MRASEVHAGQEYTFYTQYGKITGGIDPFKMVRECTVIAKKSDNIAAISYEIVTWDYENRPKEMSKTGWMMSPKKKPKRRTVLENIKMTRIIGPIERRAAA